MGLLGLLFGAPLTVEAAPDGPGDTAKSSAAARAKRRAYDGAPPVIPHQPQSARCVQCHTTKRITVPGMGLSPPSPHDPELAEGALSRCRQCHLERAAENVFKGSTFEGLRQDLRHGPKQNEFAPPRIPHRVFMRENCAACHAGPAAREPIRTPHPERARCQQCHLEIQVNGTWQR